jgi:GT2 family glycosyltransferase
MARREGGRLRGVLHGGRVRLDDTRTAWRMRRRLAGWSASWRTVPPLPPLESYDLTVVVPCFNHAPFLPYAVDSLVGQELARFRTILVDDHSSDETAALLPDLAARLEAKGPVTVVAHRHNLGQAATLNEAIGAAVTPLVAVLNDDDVLTPGALDALVSAFAADASVALVGAHSRWFSGAGAPPEDPPATAGPALVRHDPGQLGTLRAPADLNLTHSGMTLRRDVWRLVGGYRPDIGARVVPFSDRDLQLRIAALYPVVVLGDELVWWRSDSSVDAGLNS